MCFLCFLVVLLLPLPLLPLLLLLVSYFLYIRSLARTNKDAVQNRNGCSYAKCCTHILFWAHKRVQCKFHTFVSILCTFLCVCVWVCAEIFGGNSLNDCLQLPVAFISCLPQFTFSNKRKMIKYKIGMRQIWFNLICSQFIFTTSLATMRNCWLADFTYKSSRTRYVHVIEWLTMIILHYWFCEALSTFHRYLM